MWNLFLLATCHSSTLVGRVSREPVAKAMALGSESTADEAVEPDEDPSGHCRSSPKTRLNK